jgi:hypothetical protein
VLSYIDHFERTDERYRLEKFDDACAPSLSVLMRFDGKCQRLLFCSGHESRSELDSRSHVSVGLALSSKWSLASSLPLDRRQRVMGKVKRNHRRDFEVMQYMTTSLGV